MIDEGDGDEVKEGDTAVLQYLGVNGRTGEEFNSSWVDNGGEPVTFPLQEGQLIPGFLDGLVGQTYGSRVAIAIPPDDGYGPSGGNPQIGIEPDDTLIFVVDLLEAATSASRRARPRFPTTRSPWPRASRQPPAGLPELELDGSDQPTGFAADSSVAKSVDELVAAPVIVGEGPSWPRATPCSSSTSGSCGRTGRSSTSRGAPRPGPARPQPGSLIDGFLDGMLGQTVGSRVIIAIPSDLATGSKAPRPPSRPTPT